jgi:hypothetical protein
VLHLLNGKKDQGIEVVLDGSLGTRK